MTNVNTLQDPHATDPQTPEGHEVYVFPTSYGQELMFLLDQLHPGTSAYNLPLPLRIRGALRTDILEVALNELIRRHEILRTTFGKEDGKVVQYIASTATLHLSVISIATGTPEERFEKACALGSDEVKRPFDLEHGPLFTATLYVHGPKDALLVMNMHHIVADGWSFTVMLEEIGKLYDAYADGVPSPLDTLPIQYADFAVWQRDHWQGKILKDHVAYWKDRLANAPLQNQITTDHRRGSTPHRFGVLISESLPRDLTDALKVLSHREGVTPMMVYFTAFNALLYRYTGETDRVLGSPVATRSLIETERLVGYFANKIVLRTQIMRERSFTENLRAARQTLLTDYEHQDVPFELLARELHHDQFSGQRSMFQVMFFMQRAFVVPPQMRDLTMSHVVLYRGETPVDLSLHLVERDEVIRCSLEASDALFKQETINRMHRHFVTLLNSVARNPESSIDELVMTSPGESAVMPRSPGLLQGSAPPPGDKGNDHSTVLVAEAHEVAPLDPLEKRLTDIWEDVFGVRPIGVTSNFFDLGGHSMLAVQLIERIAKMTGRDLPLALLLQAPTIKQFAKTLRQDHWIPPWSPVVPIVTKTTGVPIFLVHPVGGNVLLFNALADHLGDERPVYGIQAAGLDGEDIGVTRLEDIAERYVRELRHVQPAGPYCLAGSSAGGTFAFEMARQLLAAGQHVAVLAMFDTLGSKITPSGSRVQLLKIKLRGIVERTQSFLAGFARAEVKMEFIRKKIKTLRRRHEILVDSKQMKWAQEFGRNLPKSLENAARRNLLALREYKKGEYSGRIVLFRTFAKPVGVFPEEDYGWGKFAKGGVEVVKVPGDHLSMLREPYVAVIGAALNDILKREISVHRS